jgi:hypothetical protein
MSDTSAAEQPLPGRIAAIRDRGMANWSDKEVSAELKARFEPERIPVVAIRHIRIWGIQVDDERELLGHERTSIPDEDLWEIRLRAKDGSTYEVSSELVVPAPA